MTAAKVSRIPTKPPARPAKKVSSAAAREAEAEDGFMIIEQCGLELKVPLAGKVPLKAYMAFKSGDELGGTELLLGPDQWKAFLAKDPTVNDFREFGDKLLSAPGN